VRNTLIGRTPLVSSSCRAFAVGLGPAGVRLGEYDLKVRLGRAAEGDPAEPVLGDVVAHLKAERVAVEGERLTLR
jgi:hypothetical protein